MKIEVLANPEAVAQRAAEFIAAQACANVAARELKTGSDESNAWR
ncbi:MAG: hypothetical protein WB607_29965 [Candidatus Acidiferrum sp.]|jgi:hypothetical protein